MSKTHYRNVFKSDHLGVADLEELQENHHDLIFVIKEVKQEKGVRVAGKMGDFNIAYFSEKAIKPLVLNATNSKIMKKFNEGSSFVEDWTNTKVKLYIDKNVKMKGEVVGGVRIHPVRPKEKEELNPNHPRWEDAKKAASVGKINSITKRFSVSAQNIKLLMT